MLRGCYWFRSISALGNTQWISLCAFDGGQQRRFIIAWMRYRPTACVPVSRCFNRLKADCGAKGCWSWRRTRRNWTITYMLMTTAIRHDRQMADDGRRGVDRRISVSCCALTPRRNLKYNNATVYRHDTPCTKGSSSLGVELTVVSDSIQPNDAAWVLERARHCSEAAAVTSRCLMVHYRKTWRHPQNRKY